MSGENVAQAAGIAAAIGVIVVAALCIWANESFKRDGPPDNQDGDA